MKNKALIIFVLLPFLILSCSSEDFTLSSIVLRRNIDMTGDVKIEQALLSFSLYSNDSDDTGYTFLLVSPSKDLRWEGKVEKSAVECTVDTLSITPGASFEEGEYTLYVYSSSGSEVVTAVEIAREEGNYTYANVSLKNDVRFKYYDADSFEVDSADEAAWAYAEYSDRYSNSIKLIVGIER